MRFDRLEKLIGEDKLNTLKHSTIAIFGLGGVGSYAVEAIARSGVGKLIICDFDKVDITNINRQLIALESNIGKYKTDVVKDRILDIAPETTVLAFTVKANNEIIEDIISMKPDFVIDAIDDVEAKVALVKTTLKKDIPMISAMGFANKFHPELIEITTLNQTSVCPLARTMRKRLKEEGITTNFPVVFSKELPVRNQGILGTTAYVPSVAGLMLSAYVINKMIGESI